MKVTKILPKQTLENGEEKLMCSQEVFPVRILASETSPQPDKADLPDKEADYGGKWSGQLMKSVPSMLSPKMLRIYSGLMEEKILPGLSAPFPEWGMMSNGKLCMRVMSVPPIREKGVTWLRTPVTSDFRRAYLSSPMWIRRKQQRESPGTLPEQLAWWGFNGIVNPQFVAWLMGFPITHLDIMLKQNW